MAPGTSGYSGTGAGSRAQVSQEQQEILRLKKELKQAELERDILKKAVGIFSRSDGKFFGFIKAHQGEFPVETMCKVLKVSRSGYYYWLAQRPTKRAKENETIT